MGVPVMPTPPPASSVRENASFSRTEAQFQPSNPEKCQNPGVLTVVLRHYLVLAATTR